MLESKIVTQSIKQPARALYDRFWQPETFAEWAAGLTTTGLHKDDKGWKFQGPGGECRMTFTDYNSFGVMDHWVEIGGGEQVVFAPMRVVPNREGCDVQITLFRQQDMDDARFEDDIKQVKRDLKALKELAEELKL